jgi:hypothetical protein
MDFRRHHPARTAPRSPEVDQNGNRRSPDGLIETSAVHFQGIAQRRKCRFARPTPSGVSEMPGGDAILGATGAARSDHMTPLSFYWRAALRGGGRGPFNQAGTRPGSPIKGRSSHRSRQGVPLMTSAPAGSRQDCCFSTRRLLLTENTPDTPFARMPARFLSASVATTPSRRTLPFLTMMWIGGTACRAYRLRLAWR